MNADAERRTPERVTVTLARGQREALAAIAERNNTTLAFVVRYAITRFVDENRDRQLRLKFPRED